MNKTHVFRKIAALLDVIRSYNLFLLIVAQYLAVYFIIGNKPSLRDFLYDRYLHLLILASTCSVAAGYLINAFYDSEKDSIHKPLLVRVYYFVGQTLVFRLYLLLNFLALGFGACVALKALMFFLFYQIGIWLYSHKISKKTLWNNLVSTTLAIAPFFVLFVRYKNYDLGIFIYASFLFLLLLIRDILKDLSTQRGDLIFDYSTLPLRYGEKNAKYVLSALILLFMLNGLLLALYVKEGLMRFYFLSSVLVVGGSLVLLWSVCSEKHYKFILILYTMLICFGVCCVSLISAERLNLQKYFL